MVAESKETAQIETNRLRAEYDALVPMNWPEDSMASSPLVFKGFFSLIDGAMLNYITHNVTHWCCSICHLLPCEFSKMLVGNYVLQQFSLDNISLSILHFLLRVGGHLL